MDDSCTLCDREAETSHHATVVCPQATGLRTAMREHWVLPDEEQFSYTGPDWLLLLLDRCSPVQRDLVKLVLWRAWSSHNNITHQSGPSGIHDGVQALLAMRSSLEQIEKGLDVEKGKTKKASEVLGQSLSKGKENEGGRHRGVWQRPPEGWTKINVDGSFMQADGRAGFGVVARDSTGKTIFTAWKVLFRCADAAEAEARACVEGSRFASQWAPGPVIIESDCSRIVQALRSGSDRSELCIVMVEARALAQLLVEWRVDLVKRECNKVANELAHLARRNTHTAVWLGHAPACVVDLIEADCNPSS